VSEDLTLRFEKILDDFERDETTPEEFDAQLEEITQEFKKLIWAPSPVDVDVKVQPAGVVAE